MCVRWRMRGKEKNQKGRTVEKILGVLLSHVSSLEVATEVL